MPPMNAVSRAVWVRRVGVGGPGGGDWVRGSSAAGGGDGGGGAGGGGGADGDHHGDGGDGDDRPDRDDLGQGPAVVVLGLVQRFGVVLQVLGGVPGAGGQGPQVGGDHLGRDVQGGGAVA